jgi:hypothetical protein
MAGSKIPAFDMGTSGPEQATNDEILVKNNEGDSGSLDEVNAKMLAITIAQIANQNRPGFRFS